MNLGRSANHAGWSRWDVRDIAPVVSLTVLLVFFSFATPRFWRANTIVSIFDQGATLAIVAVGLTFVLICAEIDLAVGNLATWTACFAGWLMTFEVLGRGSSADELPLWTLAVVLAVPLCSSVLFGTVSGMLTMWSRLPSFIITLAMMNIAMGCSRLITHGRTLRIPDFLHTLGNGAVALGGNWRLPYGVLLAAAVMLVAHVTLTYTRFGRYVFMTGGNREAARLAGVNTGWIVVACLAISGFTAGLGGLLNAGRMQSASVLLNANLLLDAVACVVLGGTSLFGGEGSIFKTLIGVLTFRVLEVGLQRITWIEEDARPLLTGIVLMAALVINGLLAKRSKTSG